MCYWGTAKYNKRWGAKKVDALGKMKSHQTEPQAQAHRGREGSWAGWLGWVLRDVTCLYSRTLLRFAASGFTGPILPREVLKGFGVSAEDVFLQFMLFWNLDDRVLKTVSKEWVEECEGRGKEGKRGGKNRWMWRWWRWRWKKGCEGKKNRKMLTLLSFKDGFQGVGGRSLWKTRQGSERVEGRIDGCGGGCGDEKSGVWKKNRRMLTFQSFKDGF